MPRLWFNRWAKSSSFTPSELQVLETLLPQVTSNARKLLKQAQQAPYVVRKIAGNADCEATIPYLEDDSLLVDADRDFESPSVETTDSESGRRLRFSTGVLRGGFLIGLRGTAADGGAWPRAWRIGSEVSAPAEVFTWLDSLACPMDAESASAILKRLVDWAGADFNRVSVRQQRCIRLAPPSLDSQIAECESRLGTTLPDQYKQFVKITNGFGIQRGRPYEVLGTNEIAYLDESRRWIGITPLYEDGYVVLSNANDVSGCHLLSPDGGTRRIGDLRQHVRESIEWDNVDG